MLPCTKMMFFGIQLDSTTSIPQARPSLYMEWDRLLVNCDGQTRLDSGATSPHFASYDTLQCLYWMDILSYLLYHFLIFYSFVLYPNCLLVCNFTCFELLPPKKKKKKIQWKDTACEVGTIVAEEMCPLPLAVVQLWRSGLSRAPLNSIADVVGQSPTNWLGISTSIAVLFHWHLNTDHEMLTLSG